MTRGAEGPTPTNPPVVTLQKDPQKQIEPAAELKLTEAELTAFTKFGVLDELRMQEVMNVKLRRLLEKALSDKLEALKCLADADSKIVALEKKLLSRQVAETTDAEATVVRNKDRDVAEYNKQYAKVKARLKTEKDFDYHPTTGVVRLK